MHNKYIIAYECHDNAPRMWKVVQLEKYFDFSLYSHHFSLFVVSHFSFVSTWKRSHFSLWFQSSGSPEVLVLFMYIPRPPSTIIVSLLVLMSVGHVVEFLLVLNKPFSDSFFCLADDKGTYMIVNYCPINNK